MHLHPVIAPGPSADLLESVERSSVALITAPLLAVVVIGVLMVVGLAVFSVMARRH